METDEDDLNTNRPEPKENSMENLIPVDAASEDQCKTEPGIRRSLTFYRSTKIKDIEARISYLKKELKDYRQGIRYPYEYYDDYDFDKCIGLEIENLLEEAKRSRDNDQYNKVITEYDHILMAKIYSLCIDYNIFTYKFPDFIKYIETGHFEFDERIGHEKKFKYLIFSLSSPLGKNWYKLVVKHSGIHIKRFGGLKNNLSPDYWVDKLDKLISEGT